MRVLALDTSTSACSAAVWDGGTVCADRFAEMRHGQSEHLIPMVDDVLRDAGARVADMDMIAVSTGPGTFTGVRIGLAAARGLALAASRPLRGVTTFEALAYGICEKKRHDRIVLALVDSKRGDVFTQAYDQRVRTLGDPVSLAPEDIASHWALRPDHKVVLCGDAAELFEAGPSDMTDTIVSASVYPKASTVAALAAARGLPGRNDALPRPLYLRPPDVKVRADGGRLRP